MNQSMAYVKVGPKVNTEEIFNNYLLIYVSSGVSNFAESQLHSGACLGNKNSFDSTPILPVQGWSGLK